MWQARRVAAIFFFLAFGQIYVSASKLHVLTFGRWTSVKALSGPKQDQAVEIRMRPLYVDSALKAYTFGTPHEITERLFAVQRMVRVNDSLPAETAAPRWIWLRGGWLIVDRVSGRITPADLPDYDLNDSIANWYRDYVAYCGVSPDGRKIFALVVQVGRRKPILKQAIGEASGGSADCDSPIWQREPTRVTFSCKPDQKKATYAIRSSAVQIDEDDVEGND